MISLRHDALVYDSEDAYLARAVPFVREGIEDGEGAIVAHTKPGLAMMREALGPDAAHVRFVDVSSAYTRPAKTLAAYHRVFVERLREAPTLRVVADVQFGPDPAEWGLWTGYEAVFNRSFAHFPAWVMCSYDANRAPDPIIEGVWQTHPEVVADGIRQTSDRYEDPDRLLRRVTPVPAPLPELRSIPFGDVEAFRERLAGELAAAQVSETKAFEMLLAASEVAANAVRHGGGVEDVRVGSAQGRFVARSSTAARASTIPPPATSSREKASAAGSGSPAS